MKRRVVLAMMVAVTVPGLAVAAAARDRLVASPAWLAARLGDPGLVILQVGDKPGYEAGHIPGARLVSLTDFAAPPSGPDPLFLEIPTAEVLRTRLSALGIGDRSTIVVVPTREGIQSATRVIFTLDAAGLGARTRLLEGGTAAFAAAGQALSRDPPGPAAAGRLSPIQFRPLLADRAAVMAALGRPGWKVVDARAPEFYSGARPGGMPGKPHRPGHIEGAASVPFTSVTTPDLKLAPEAEIAARFKAAGVKPGDKVIAYCHVGQQATATLFAARTLGIDVKLYDGSFEEWSRTDGPVATGP
jgi:thiosulfate/3-mercaptopyruvate sulfurtransferase